MNPTTPKFNNVDPSQLYNTLFPEQDPSQVANPIQQSQGQDNPLLDFLLPTAGASLGALVPGLGETGISEAGGAAVGQYLSDLIQGKSPGADVAITGATSFLLPKILSPFLGGISKGAGKIANTLTGVAPRDIFQSVVAKDPWALNNASTLANTANSLGYTKMPMRQAMVKMPQDFSNMQTRIESALQGSDRNIPLYKGIADQPSLRDNYLQELDKSNYTPEDLTGANNWVSNRIKNLGTNKADPLSVYQEKQSMAKLLGKTFDKQDAGGTLLPMEEARMAYYNGLKNTIDQYVDPSIREVNTKQNHLFDISRAFMGKLNRQIGSTGPRFGFNDFWPIGGAETAHLMGGNPLIGGLLGYGAEKAVNSPVMMKGAQNLFSLLGNTKFLSGAGAGIAGAGQGVLQPNSPLSNPLASAGILTGDIGGSPTVNPSLSPQGVGFPINGGITSNPGSNGGNGQSDNQGFNQNNSSPFGGNQTMSNSNNISQLANNVNTTGQTSGVQSFDGKTTFPAQLPQPVNISNQIPGQTYTNDQFEADSQKIAQAAVANAYNPAAMDALKVQQQAINDMHNSNTQRVDMYLQQQGLDAGAQDFVRTANPQWNSLTQLHELLKSNGGQNLFQSFMQANPTVQTLLAAKDPRYALMFNLLGQQKLAQARIAQGGTPRQYDIALSYLGAGNTAAANAKIVEYAMGQFLDQYKQYSPLYGLKLSSGGSTPNTPTQTSQSQMGGLYQTLGIPGGGGQ